MHVQIDYKNGLYNRDINIKDADWMETSPVREVIWESEVAFVESRSFDSEVELIYGECQQQPTLQENYDQLYVQVMQELDYWSYIIANGRSQDEDCQKDLVTTTNCNDEGGPPEVIFIPTARLLNSNNNQDKHSARAVQTPEQSCVLQECMFLSKAKCLSRATTY